MNEVRRPVVAVDVPTGVDATTGEVAGPAVQADFTAALGFLKLGCLFYPGRSFVGDFEVLDIGIPHRLAEDIQRFLLEPEDLAKLPPRPPWGHKGTFGHTLVVVGSQGMVGAACLVCKSSLSRGWRHGDLSGTSFDRRAFPPDEVIVKPVPDTPEGTLGSPSIDTLRELLKGKDVLAVGPGLSNRPEVKQIVEYLLRTWTG